MGEVYRATDTSLKRQVAIKVLPATVAGSSDHLARFQREAEVLAALNHPNIAQIYGIERSSGTVALVMELVEGPTLADRIALGPMPLDEVLAIAKQITDALEAAHEQGIVHRDLKPANIKVRPDGTVKVLDFGLAKALDQGAGTGEQATRSLANSPTISVHATQAGIILGTAAYMSPEQAAGKTVDKRTDLWSFGVIVFEMLTGRRAFDGESVSHIIASVLKDSPDLSVLPGDTPAAVRKLLRRCLEKDRRKRLADAADARYEIEDASAEPAAVVKPVRRSGVNMPTIIAAVVAVLMTGVAATFVATGWRSASPVSVSRLSVLPPANLSLFADSSSVTISPDGQTIALLTGNATFTSNAPLELWLRRLDGLAPTRVTGANGAINPFWSPDSRQLAFFSNRKLRRLELATGRIDDICDAPDGRGGSWNTDDVIVFAPTNNGALFRVSVKNGKPEPVTKVASDQGETGHRYPALLPDGQHFLYVALPAHNNEYDVWVGSLDGTTHEHLMKAESAPIYSNGYLLYSRKDTLAAQRFDATQRKVIDDPVTLAEHPGSVGDQFFGEAAVSVDAHGTMAYLAPRPEQTNVVWLNLEGHVTGSVQVPPAHYNQIRLAPNGKVASLVQRVTSTSGALWIADLLRGGATPLTDAGSVNYFSIWSPDSTTVAFSSLGDGPAQILAKSVVDGTQSVILKSPVQFKFPESWSPDRKYLVYYLLDPVTGNDIWLLPLTGDDRTLRPLMHTNASESYAMVSPDSRWMLYVSDETGRDELYVESFPVPGRKFRVSSTGVQKAWWRSDGKQIMTASIGLTDLMVADVTAGAEFSASAPRPAGHVPPGVVDIDMTPDLQRVIALVSEGGNIGNSITVVQNWKAAIEHR